MQEISFQNYAFPAVYITGLSYTKSARLWTDGRGFARFLGFEPAEISVRIAIDAARAMACERDFIEDFNLLQSIPLVRDSIPTQVVYASHILYPSLEFRITSINRTIATDHAGLPIGIEADITLSGVACTKDETGRKALVFNEAAILPDVTITCNGRELVVSAEFALSDLRVRPDALDAEILIGDDLSIVQDKPWMLALVENTATISVDGYGVFYIVSADLIEGALKIQASRWKPQTAETKTYQDSDLSAILADLAPDAVSGVSGGIKYYLRQGTALQAIKKLQSSAGFLIDYAPNSISFRDVPDALIPDVDFDVYLDSDMNFERINGAVWKDSENTYTVGTNPRVEVDSVFTGTDSRFADRCLKYAKYMQNYAIVTTSIDSRVKHHSMLNVIKGNQMFSAMVESFEIDFIAGSMQLELHSIKR